MPFNQYKRAGMVQDFEPENGVIFYEGKKGYRDWAWNSKAWPHEGLNDTEYKVQGYLDLDTYQPVPIRAHVEHPDLEPNTDYLVCFGTNQYGYRIGIRSTSCDKAEFCDDFITHYIPFKRNGNG